jgi:hypothetical protein
VRVLSIVARADASPNAPAAPLTHPSPIATIVALLQDDYDVQPDRAAASIRLAVTIGRLDTTTDDEGTPCVQTPSERNAA